MSTDDHSAHELAYENIDDPDGYFGEAVAAHYDDPSSPVFGAEAVDPAVELIAGLAGGPGGDARALEFGIGTGRIALPLARRGVQVHGIDLSRAMVERMRAKPGGADIGVTLGDFATTRVDGPGFTVAYLVFNTINNLTTQDAQVDCFRNAAAHLLPGGRFVVEVGVPDLRRLPPGQNAVPFHVGPTRLGFDTYDVATQGMRSHHMVVVEGRPVYRSIPFRYVWPAELDLMARLAGLRLRNRWEGWKGEPFTNDSTGHVSVWEKV
ncbi:methyltransferase domain-containing protein [Streptomyces scabiei]|uniref:class I SAM-dependent DNA methyltransferase n=1 Tax=Streptomyces scabiei TaxID=1930 RepID=UPI001BB56CA7|nr:MULTISPECIES: class I SAM-dependent methyltransferase [Streptomyces]MBP5868002.1 class I SAM-dependent methyltransferase [Streptomyces sp. LBUM 1485]MBP5916187.1 class I SAM-dependent methyltransferase [Streptomyces sp. LBUM 1486]MDX3033838.1 methyltransferase domain-containing protein [Streptomyces scabiei]MDX3211980.1 methyltransferase domain-containing protein [Streptomyces scabiei]QTU54609.1 class I SAM-dependent methyltransferase [Streptomyces sp. LBUM 1480]